MPHRNWVGEIEFCLPLIKNEKNIAKYYEKVFEEVREKVRYIIQKQSLMHYESKIQINLNDEQKRNIFDKIAKWWASNLWETTVVSWTLASKLNMILGDENLVSLFIMLLMTWVIKISDNPINKFSLEFEVKILEQNDEQVKKALQELQPYEVRFQGVVYDIYHAHKLEEDGRIIRLRRKKDISWEKKAVLTLKKKIKNPDERILNLLEEQVLKPFSIDNDEFSKLTKVLRICFEEEFLIESLDIVNDILRFIHINQERAKIKFRSSYILYDWEKGRNDRNLNWNLDRDDYFRSDPRVNNIVEPDLKDLRSFLNVLSAFGISNYDDPRLSGVWSSTLFKQYWAWNNYLKSPLNLKKISKILQESNILIESGYFKN